MKALEAVITVNAIHDLGLVAWLAVAATFLLAGGVKGVVGLGLPTVAMGLLGLFLPPAQAAVLLLLPSFVTNIWQMGSGGWGAPLWAAARRLWSLQLGVVVGTLCSPVGLSNLDARLGALGLGLALLVYAVCGLGALRLAVPPRWQAWASPLVGVATGVVTAATGVFVFPAVPYLQGLGMDKDRLVQAMGLSFLVSTLALAWRLAADGAMPAASLGTLGLGVLPLLMALLGMGLGQRLRQRLSEARFRRVFFAGMGVVALQLLFKGAA